MKQLALPRPFYQAARLRVLDLSPQAQDRLRWLTVWQALRAKGCTSTEAAHTLGLSRATLSRWEQRSRRAGLRGLEPRSRRPHRVRQANWDPGLVAAVLTVREARPRWGKAKLAPLLRVQGWSISVSTCGRILRHLKTTGQLREAPLLGRPRARHAPRRPYAVRKPKAYLPRLPGDLVQVDTLDLRPLPGVALKQFTARDVVSRWDVLRVGTQATATAATRFLDDLQARYPFPLRAIQVDGGSEFMANFEVACQQRGLRLFVLPPRSPKLNGHVERANRTHTEEFWQCYDGDLDVASAGAALLAWERVYNTERPHQALAYRTPLQYLRDCHPDLAPSLSHMY